MVIIFFSGKQTGRTDIRVFHFLSALTRVEGIFNILMWLFFFTRPANHTIEVELATATIIVNIPTLVLLRGLFPTGFQAPTVF